MKMKGLRGKRMTLSAEELKILRDMLKEAELLARYNSSNGVDYDRYKILSKIWNSRKEFEDESSSDK